MNAILRRLEKQKENGINKKNSQLHKIKFNLLELIKIIICFKKAAAPDGEKDDIIS